MSDNYGFIHSYHYDESITHCSLPMLKEDLFKKLTQKQIKSIHETSWVRRKVFHNKEGFGVTCYSVDNVKELLKVEVKK